MMGKIHAALLAATLIGGYPGTPLPLQAEMRELRFADYGNTRGTRSKALQWFDEELRRRSAGQLGLRFFWGGSRIAANPVTAELDVPVLPMELFARCLRFLIRSFIRS